MSSEVAIEVEGLGKSYFIYERPEDRLKQMIVPKLRRLIGRAPRLYYSEFWALKNISFSVGRGETVGIIGRNGSGKSTLLQLIVGTLSATTGSVHSRGRIAALLELGAGFNPEFTGRENALLNATILGLSNSEAQARMAEIVAFADIGEFFDRPVKTYSSGMFVRVAFAVQACIEPDILVVDEALAVGDEKFQRKCFDRLEKLRKNGTSILLVTHSATTIERFCQRALLLHQGELHNIGPSNQIVDQYHALLYADRVAYASLRAKGAATLTPPVSDPESTQADAETSESRATILSVRLLNDSGITCEHFTPGQSARVELKIKCSSYVPEMQIGIKIRTVEGVFAFGTSTLYHARNVVAVESDEVIGVVFQIALNLCEDAYFISVAVAGASISGDMRYLDKQTDVLFFRIAEPRVRAGGIAFLPVNIEIERRA
ncbi:ABC transporter ATP-binding protein [Hyphomicrobium methylovorum]|nr:ABC transporter ATP-binding protein [Hyphomicrobium methylovorum]